MHFDKYTMKKGGKVTIPGSFVNTGEGEIVEVTNAGIVVLYNEGKNEQISFYSFEWLNQEYGGGRNKEPPPWDDPIPNFG